MKKTNFSMYALLAGFFVLGMLTVLFGIYIDSGIRSINSDIKSSLEISDAALDFSAGNFEAQLQLWEYAYEPTDERLLSFEDHVDVLASLLDRWSSFVSPGYLEEGEKVRGLFLGGEGRVNEISRDFEIIRGDWDEVLRSIGEVRVLIELGYDNESHVNHFEYMGALVDARERVVLNENLFDKLEFNEKVDYFIENQEYYLDGLFEEQKSFVNRFLYLLGVIITLFVILGMCFVVFIYHYILKINPGEKR